MAGHALDNPVLQYYFSFLTIDLVLLVRGTFTPVSCMLLSMFDVECCLSDVNEIKVCPPLLHLFCTQNLFCRLFGDITILQLLGPNIIAKFPSQVGARLAQHVRAFKAVISTKALRGLISSAI